MKIYKSKVGWWLGLVLVYPIFSSVASIIEGEWIGYIGIGLCLLFIVNDKIEISKIRKIEKTNSILSSPALSLDRISIKFNKYDEVYISPKERQAFIDELLKINPEI